MGSPPGTQLSPPWGDRVGIRKRAPYFYKHGCYATVAKYQLLKNAKVGFVLETTCTAIYSICTKCHSRMAHWATAKEVHFNQDARGIKICIQQQKGSVAVHIKYALLDEAGINTYGHAPSSPGKSEASFSCYRKMSSKQQLVPELCFSYRVVICLIFLPRGTILSNVLNPKCVSKINRKHAFLKWHKETGSTQQLHYLRKVGWLGLASHSRLNGVKVLSEIEWLYTLPCTSTSITVLQKATWSSSFDNSLCS